MSDITISEAFKNYRTDFIVMSNQSKKTEEAYMNTRLLLIRFLGDVKITEITFENIRDWKIWMSRWQQPDTVRGNIINLRMVLKFLLSKNQTVVNYESIPVPKREKHIITYLNYDEVALFIKEAGKKLRGYSKLNRMRNVAIITLLYATGLRNGELCALNRDSIKDRTFTVVGKSKDPRICFINREAEEAIKNYINLRVDGNKALFISHQTGERITTGVLRQIFTNICNRSDFKHIHPHTIRHSYATYLLSKRVDIRYIGDLMGHSDLNTTKVYTHYVDNQLREVYENAYK